MRRAIVMARDPYIMVTLVLVIARDPHKSAFRRRPGMFINGSRWPNANHNLRYGTHRTKGESEQNCQCNLLPHESYPPGMSCAHNGCTVVPFIIAGFLKDELY
jgi:hypothetical protein